MGMIRRRGFLALGAGSAVSALFARHARAAANRAAQVVIIGGGFSGSCCALELRRSSPDTQVTLVDEDARYVTCPLSDLVVTGRKSLPAITVTRGGLTRAGIRVIRVRARSLDPAQRLVRLQDGNSLHYDRLVIAPGIRLLFGTPEGYDETAATLMPHAWQAGEQTRLLAAQLQAVPNGGTVAISVPIGLMRCPPGPYERASLIAYWLSRHRPRSKVVIFDSNNHFPRQDVFTAAWQQLYPGLIEWLPPSAGGTVNRLDARSRTLFTSAGAQRVALANVIPPQAPGAIALEAGLASGHGWCPTSPVGFESQHIPGIHVIGDACIAGAMPKTASAARSQAVQCAAAIAAALAGRAAPATPLTSVCYGLLGPQSAFAMRARFEVTAGEIRTAPADATEASELAPGAEHAAQAQRWYQEMREACFGA
jgi:sulfide dehydrogenase [flavocytochrome c] flavoprotein subunit